MDIAKFHAAINAITEDNKKNKIDEEFGSLIAKLDSMNANPTNIEVAKLFRDQLDTFKLTLRDSILNEMPAEFYSVASQLGLLDYIGKGLYERIRDSIEQNQLTPSLASAALTNLRVEASKKLSVVAFTASAFATLGVPFEDYSNENAEVTIELPIAAESKTLEDLAKEAKDWHRIVDVICEIFDNEHTRITIRSLATGSWLFYLAATPCFIHGIAKCITGVNLILTELLKSKDLYSQLVAAKYPSEVLVATENHNSGKVKIDLDRLAASLVEEFYQGVDAGRKNELKTSLNIALTRLSHKIASGSKISLRLTPPKTPKIVDGIEPSDEEKLAFQRIEKVEKIQMAIRESIASIEYGPRTTELTAALPAPSPVETGTENSSSII